MYLTDVFANELITNNALYFMYQNTIKNSLLRKDNTLYSIMNTLNSTMSAGYTSNGETKYLFSFGIEKLDYFKADENERYAFHINGDEDDEDTNELDNDLMAAIASDPEGTVEFFVNLSKTLYDNLTEAMGRSEYSSMYTSYDDKTMEEELTSYDKKIKEAQQKVEDYEDKWYDKFTAMEVALSKLQSSSNSLSSLLGS